MRMSVRQSAFATTILIAMGAAAAAAVPPAGSDPITPRPAATAGATSRAEPSAHRSLAGQIDQRITDLHAKLQITPDQQQLWDKFAQVMRDNARSMDETFRHRVQTLPGMTAPENMQSYAEVATTHAQDVQKLVPAFQALYDVMSESQKRLADQAFRDGANHGAHARQG
jgi:periplasmic protein CpxP/Spy